MFLAFNASMSAAAVHNCVSLLHVRVARRAEQYKKENSEGLKCAATDIESNKRELPKSK
jgi:hypothetical protein